MKYKDNKNEKKGENARKRRDLVLQFKTFKYR